MRRVAILVVVFAATLSAQPALPIPGGAIVWTDTAPNSANMYDPATGMTTVLSTAPTLIWPSGILVTKQRDVVFADFNGLTLTRVDVLGNESPVGLVTNTPNRIAEDHNGDFLIAAYATGSWGGKGGGSGRRRRSRRETSCSNRRRAGSLGMKARIKRSAGCV